MARVRSSAMRTVHWAACTMAAMTKKLTGQESKGRKLGAAKTNMSYTPLRPALRHRAELHHRFSSRHRPVSRYRTCQYSDITPRHMAVLRRQSAIYRRLFLCMGQSYRISVAFVHLQYIFFVLPRPQRSVQSAKTINGANALTCVCVCV